MSCEFTSEHYVELLLLAKAGGYRWATFDHEPQPGDLFLRHDVDLSLEFALKMARLEAERGIVSTWFLMTGSSFYNLSSPAGRRLRHELRRLGHRVGLHAVWPEYEQVFELDDQHDPVLSWHTPELWYMSEPVVAVTNVMTPPWFDPATYRSDSNGRWRHGCPCEELRAGAFEWLQLLIHPETWLLPGDTMTEKMEALFEIEWARRWLMLSDYRIDVAPNVPVR